MEKQLVGREENAYQAIATVVSFGAELASDKTFVLFFFRDTDMLLSRTRKICEVLPPGLHHFRNSHYQKKPLFNPSDLRLVTERVAYFTKLSCSELAIEARFIVLD